MVVHLDLDLFPTQLLIFFFCFYFVAPTDEKPYICRLCDFVTTESSAYLSHVRLQHPAAPDSSPSPSSSSDRATPSSYPKLKRALLQGLAQSAAPHPYLSAQASKDKGPSRSSSPADLSLTPVDLCVRAEGHRGLTSVALNRKDLPSHKCSFCSHSTRYPEVLWMHQTVAHRINSNSSKLAPKWALKNGIKGTKDGSSSSRRRTGPPPVLEGKECPPLPPIVRTPRTRPPATRPPTSSSEGQKKNRAAGHPSTSSSSSSSSSSSRSSSSTSGSQAMRHPPRPVSSSSRATEDGARSRPKVDIYPRGGSSSSSTSSLEKSTGVPHRLSVPSPSSAAGARLADRYMIPQEGLGFMLSSKHGLAEYSRARGSPQPSKTSSPHQPHPNYHNQARANTTRPSAIAHSSSIGHGYGGSQTHGGTLQSSPSSSSSSGPRGDVKQEVLAETPEMPIDILSFLKNYSPHDLAALYHRWGAANALLDPTGKEEEHLIYYEFIMNLL